MSTWIKTEEQRERHKEKCRAYYRASLAANPELNKIEWQKKKARLIAEGKYEAYIARGRTQRAREYARARARFVQPDRMKREALVRELGGCCARCGYDADIRALVLDHKNGDGYLDRKRLGSKVHRYYAKHPEEARKNLQILCSNCNTIKAIDEKEHNRSRRVDN